MGMFTTTYEDENFEPKGGSSISWDDVDRPKDWELDERDNEGRQFVTRWRRILAGPIARGVCMIPVTGVVSSTKEISWLPITIPRNEDGFDIPDIIKIADEADTIVKTEAGYDLSKCAHPFRPQYSYFYIVLCRESKTIRFADYNTSTKNGIKHVQWEINKKDTSLLLNGPYLLYDVSITKYYDSREKGLKRTSYEVAADPDNKFRNEVPKKVMTEGFPKNFPWDKVFTEQEHELIQSMLEQNNVSTLKECLENTVKSMEMEKSRILEILSKLNPNATDKNGAPIFPNPDKFLAKVHELSGVKLIQSAGASFDNNQQEKKTDMPDISEDKNADTSFNFGANVSVNENDVEDVEFTENNESEQPQKQQTNDSPFGAANDKASAFKWD